MLDCELLESLVEASVESNLREFLHEEQVLLIDDRRRRLVHLFEEAVDDRKAQLRSNLLDQVVHSANHLFVLAKLALPDKVY